MSLKVRVWTAKILKYDDVIIMINFVRLSSATKKTGHVIKRVRQRRLNVFSDFIFEGCHIYYAHPCFNSV